MIIRAPEYRDIKTFPMVFTAMGDCFFRCVFLSRPLPAGA